ncbi:hypothetical protein FRC17_006566 [Serendipita sp. 399]|nr:hypothetical protein FRC17_006566 [Serendipita sp. 399]
MSSCHLRLPHPSPAQQLIDYLNSHNLVQLDGSDAVGTTLSSGPEESNRHIVTELVEGRAEAIYWEKVPEKIKRAAISKMIKLDGELKASRKAGVEAVGVASGGKAAGGGEEDEREKKRRKRV